MKVIIERSQKLRQMAIDKYVNEDCDVYIDETALISETDNLNGAFVQAWVWVGFAGTEFDK